MVGCCLAPRNVYNLESVIMEIVHRNRGADLLVTINLNTYLKYTDRNKCYEAITAEMVMEGLKDMMYHLLPWKIQWT